MATKNWAKFNYSYTRNNAESGTRSAILTNIDISNVTSEVEEWVKSWTGTGEVVVLTIETGPYAENQLTESQCAELCKTYAFDDADNHCLAELAKIDGDSDKKDYLETICIRSCNNDNDYLYLIDNAIVAIRNDSDNTITTIDTSNSDINYTGLLTDYIASTYDYDDRVTAEVLVDFELLDRAIDYLTIAKDDDVNVKIWCEYYFHNGTIISHPAYRFLRVQDNDYGNKRIFSTHADAQKWINEQESQTYIVSHGEYTSPAYYIVTD